MDLLKFIMHLGIVFAIFGFVWFFLMIGINILTAGRKSKLQHYIFKLIKYMFLASVTARFILEFSGQDFISKGGLSYFIVGGLILLMYLVGKLQKQENAMQMQAMMAKMMPQVGQPFYDRNMEIATIGIAVLNFALCIIYPAILNNAFISWFSETIHGIYEAPIFGFIFKVIGFFFLLNILFKGITSIGRALGIMPPPPEVNTNFNFEMFQNMQNNPFENQEEKENDYDDFEEVDEDKN